MNSYLLLIYLFKYLFTMNNMNYGTTAGLMSYKTGNPMMDMLLMTIIGTIIGGLTTTVVAFFRNMDLKSFCKIKKHIKKLLFGKEYEIIIEHSFKSTTSMDNNKLLIEALTHGVNECDNYKMMNRKVQRDYMSNYEMEINRNLLRLVNYKYEKEGICVKYNLIETEIDEKNKKKEPYKEKLILTSRKPIEYIESYIKKKRDEYIKKIVENDDDKIHIYSHYSVSLCHVNFQKVFYNQKKNFSSWFNPNKEKILNITSDFKNKTGMYKFDTTQHKLGIYLHGEPGCGKTSFIKALASELNRSVIVLQLDKIDKLKALKCLFFDKYICHYGKNGLSEQYSYLPLNKRIIVFEDIDTAGDIVLKREFKADYKKENDEIKNKINKIKEGDNDISIKDIENITDLFGKTQKKHNFKISDKNITLGDLLNIFDGMCELEDLVYVVTTNCPEKIDPALTRPGRMTIDLELKRMESNEIAQILNYYFREEYGDINKIIDNISNNLNLKLKPSKIENMCITMTLLEILEYSISLSKDDSFDKI